MASKVKLIKFTCASSKDRLDAVTVTAKRLGVNDVEELVLKLRRPGSKKSYSVTFYMNRFREGGETYKSCSWPEDFPVPDVGNPVELEVLSIT